MTAQDDEDARLRSVALQNAASILVARQRADQRTEAYLAEAQRLSHTGSFGWRPSTGDMLWSEEAFRIFQYNATLTPTVDVFLERVSPEDAPLVKRTFARASRDGSDFDFECRLLIPDGGVKHVHVVGHALSDESGAIEFAGAVMDVTEQYHGRAALQTAFEEIKTTQDRLAGEKRLLEMIARGESGPVILDALCRYIEELNSGSLSSILVLDAKTGRLRNGASPSLPRQYVEAIDGARIGPSAGSCGTAAYHATPVIVSDIAADPLWADYRDLALPHGLRACWSTPILSSDRRVLGTFAIYYREPRIPSSQEHGVVEQITHLASIALERVEREERLREQASLLDLTHDSVFARDMRDVITYWNRGAEELYGWTRAEALGTVCHQLTQTIFPAPLPHINAELLRTGRWEGELIHTKRDGTEVVVASRWSLQRGEQNEPLTILETNNDVTERKRAEEALREAQANLSHVSRVTTLGEMAASVAHEVDQPLSGVVINANACLRFLSAATPNLDEVRDGLNAIARDGRRASEVTARIRALARRTATEKEPLDINEVIREVVALAEGEALRIRASLGTELAGNLTRVLGDRVQLQQVVLNLVLNGLAAMHDVASRPRALVISTEREGRDHVRVAVKDSGSGIDPQLVARIFDAFYTTKPGGLGMGLSISRSIVEQHGGRLWAVPNDGPGTTFHFTV